MIKINFFYKIKPIFSKLLKFKLIKLLKMRIKLKIKIQFIHSHYYYLKFQCHFPIKKNQLHSFLLLIPNKHLLMMMALANNFQLNIHSLFKFFQIH
jgi:hypothetical protein